MSRLPDQRSAFAVVAESASKVSTIAVAFTLPAVVGFGLDRWWSSGPVFTLVGVVSGFAVGLSQIMRLAREIPGRRPAGGIPLERDPGASPSQEVIKDNNRPGPPEM